MALRSAADSAAAGRRIPSVPEDVLEPFRRAHASDVSDLVGPLYTMDPVDSASAQPMCAHGRRRRDREGSARRQPGHSWGAQLIAAGQVLVVDWRGHTQACGSGSKALAAPHERGLAGIVIDGAWRDVAEVEQMGLPLFGRVESLVSPAKSHLGEIGFPSTAEEWSFTPATW